MTSFTLLLKLLNRLGKQANQSASDLLEVSTQLKANEIKTLDLADKFKHIQLKQGDKGERGDPGEKGEKGDDGQDGAKGERGEKGDRGEDGKDGHDGENGIDGKDGKDGRKGEQGEKGSKGDKGEPGKDGEDGTDGTDGKDANRWLEGAGVPKPNLGKDEDFYLNIVNADVWKKENGEWFKLMNIKGEKGKDGKDGRAGFNGFSGSVSPHATIWGEIIGDIIDQVDLQTALDGKSNIGHTHTASQITDFDTEVSNNADVAANTASRHDPATPGAGISIVGQEVTNSDRGSLAITAHELAYDHTAIATNTADLAAHLADTANPHSVTKTQVGLSSVTNDAQLKIASNLSDLNNVTTARTNLGLGTAALVDTGVSSGNVPVLDGAGKLSIGVLPGIALTDTFVVGSEAAMLALSAQTGDVAVRTDLNKTFILKGTDATVLGDWQELLTPTDTVSSVFGRSGAVTAQSGDYDLDLVAQGTTTKKLSAAEYIDLTDGNDSTLHYHASDRDRANHTGTQLLATISDVTASPSELNILDGATLTTIELNHVDGVTSAIQTQLDSKQSLITNLDNIVQGIISRKLVVVDLVTVEYEIILSGEQDIDGVTTSNSRVLVTFQENDYTTNGIYITGPGAWVRASDFDTADEIENSLIQVQFGDTFAGSGWQCITNPITLGVTEIFFTRPTSWLGVQSGGGAVTLGHDYYGIYAQFNPGSVTHNQLGSLQGGSSTERYHLTAAAAASLGSKDAWVTLTSQPALVTNGFMVYAGRKYSFSARGNDTTTWYRYDHEVGTWSTMTAAPDTMNAGSYGVWTGGKYIYVFRGKTTTTFWRYDISADTWATMAVAPGTIVAGSTLVYIGGDYIIATKGGSTTVYRYSISGDAWVTMPGVTPANFGDGSSGVYPGQGDIIYYIRANNTATVYEYSISKDTWATGIAMPNSGGLGSSSAFDGQEYIYATTGGASGAAFNRFSITLRTWEALTSVPTAPAGGASLVWVTDRLLLTECNGADPAFYSYFPGRVSRIGNYGNRGDWYRAATSAQFDKVNNTLADITGLSAQVFAGKTYRFEARLFTTSNALYGVKAAIAGTCTATAIRYEGLTTDAGVTTQTRAAALGTAVGAVTAVTNAYIIITGVITVNAAGTLTVQFAQNVTNATVSSVLTLSTFVVTELNT